MKQRPAPKRPSERATERTFSSDEALSLTHIGQTQLAYLVRTGAIAPTLEAPRRGMPRQFSFFNLLEISLAAELLQRGLSVRGIGELLSRLRMLNDADPNLEMRRSQHVIAYPPEYAARIKADRERSAFDAQRWIDFKKRARPAPGWFVASFFGGLVTAAGRQGLVKEDRTHCSSFHFLDKLSDIEEAIEHDEVQQHVQILLNVGAIVSELEEETGERL